MTTQEARIDILEQEVLRLTSVKGDIPARIARNSDADSEVYPVVVTRVTRTMVNGVSTPTNIFAKRIIYSDSPPINGNVEFEGEEFEVYPPPCSTYEQIDIPNAEFTGVLNSVTSLNPMPFLAVTNSMGDTEIYLQLKPNPGSTFLPLASNKLVSEGSG